MRNAFAFMSAAVLLAACLETVPPPATQVGQGVAGFLNGSATTADVEVDGAIALTGVAPSTAGSVDGLVLTPGQHFIRVRATGTATGGAQLLVIIPEGGRQNVVGYQTPGSPINARVLEDTGAIVPAGKSKVRVLNLVPNSDIDIWRTQPDFQQATRFQFPFPFNPEPGPYLQSDAGVWNVWITPTNNASLRLHETGPINISSGDKRTIVVVDSSGVLRLRVLKD